VLDKLEQQALSDKTAPIVILPAKENQLAASVAPNEISLGFILPYTPLHSILMQCLGYPVVMTSGNIS
jgi:hydrogenase maturation protein HypF